MFKNLSVITKIAGGFGIILIMLAVIATEGIVRLGDSSDGFTSYREFARETNLAGRIQANLLLSRIGAIEYTTSNSDEHLAQFSDRFSKLHSFVEEAEKMITDPARAELVARIKKNIVRYNKNFQTFLTETKTEKESLALAQKSGEKIVAGLQELLKSATQREDSFMTAMTQKSLAALYKARLTNSYFLFKTKTQEDASKAIETFEEFEKALQDIQNILYAPADLGLINELRGYNAQYVKHTKIMIKTSIGQAAAKAEMDKIGPEIARLVEDLKIGIMKEQDTLGPRMHSSIKKATSTMTISSVATLALGLLLAVLIARSITVPLKKASTFVKDLAVGRLDSRMEVDQKDEVGMICKDMTRVGDTLKKVMSEIDTAINGIEAGSIDSKADSSAFEGSFAELIDRTNLATDVLRSFIGEVPMPIMTMDRDKNILYINKAGIDLLGKSLEELKRGKCHTFISAADCGTERCACTRAVQSNSVEHGSTLVRMPGGNLDIDYIGVPIEKDGKVVGTMEIILDQTAVRSAQKRMQDVAERTQLISEQLSSASEELSAQVEQISSGSELQRERIVETATAMDQMNSTTIEVAHNASAASAKSAEAKNEAENGARMVEESVRSITEVRSIAEDLRDNMRSLGDQTDSISTVMDVITDIADQTNLLALNAAIEAARAGEAGRGFAVVADEVRKLAEKTMTATHEVGENIKSIQVAVRTNMQDVENAVNAVQETTDLANKSGETLQSIVSTVDFSANQVESIAAASEEQSAVSEQINRALSEINNVARETDEGIQQSAKAIQELAVMSGELHNLIGELRSK